MPTLGTTDASDDLYFAAVAFHGDTHRLARLLVDDLEVGEKWLESDLGAMFSHQLSAPLEPESGLPGRGRADSNGDPSPTPPRLTYREAIFGELVSVESLRRIKEHAKAHLVKRDPCFPTEIARLLYYASVVAARWKCGVCITSLTDSECLTGVRWVIDQDWVDQEVRDWFRSARRDLFEPV